VSVGEFLVDDAVGHLVGVEATVLFGNCEPREAEFGEFVPHVLGELLVFVGLVDVFDDLLGHELPYRVPYQSLFLC
jgi:hypothetical protein